MADIETCRFKIPDFRFLLFFIVLIFFFSGCSRTSSDSKGPFTKTANPEIIQLTPKKPVRIVLKRTSRGDYTWELRGDDAGNIISADRRLRRYLSENDSDEKGEAKASRLQK
ncbi:hypothetical protein BMS3Bbin07_00951 [bacterium BMS3Bbin07]|nr:hypothetical protein BMS3Bbin07_00951 [bacterium BMS3Bbin07]HDH01713.1 hypothetical protein [Nitrospirota bacterium]